MIIMTAHGNDGPHQGVDCMKLGAADYIPKPFPITGRTLSKAIMESLENSGQAGNRATTTKRPSGSPRPFEGGRMILFKRRVEICGVDVPISPAMHKILTLLSEKRSNGKYAAYAGSDLMEMLRVDCGQNGIASQRLEFRNKVGQRLLEEANITCGRTDVLNSGGPGYRLQEWITVQVGTRAGNAASVAEAFSADDGSENPDTATMEFEGDEADDLNDRQRWAIGQLELGVQLQVRHLTKQFGCSSITAKRDLLALKSAGLVRFVGSPRAGHYQLTSAGKRQFATRAK